MDKIETVIADYLILLFELIISSFGTFGTGSYQFGLALFGLKRLEVRGVFHLVDVHQLDDAWKRATVKLVTWSVGIKKKKKTVPVAVSYLQSFLFVVVLVVLVEFLPLTRYLGHSVFTFKVLQTVAGQQLLREQTVAGIGWLGRFPFRPVRQHAQKSSVRQTKKIIFLKRDVTCLWGLALLWTTGSSWRWQLQDALAWISQHPPADQMIKLDLIQCIVLQNEVCNSNKS